MTILMKKSESYSPLPKPPETVILSPSVGRRISRYTSDLIALSRLFTRDPRPKNLDAAMKYEASWKILRPNRGPDKAAVALWGGREGLRMTVFTKQSLFRWIWRWKPPTSSRGSEAFQASRRSCIPQYRALALAGRLSGAKAHFIASLFCRRTGSPAPPTESRGLPPGSPALSTGSRGLPPGAFHEPSLMKLMPLPKSRFAPMSVPKKPHMSFLALSVVLVLFSSHAFSQQDKFQGVVTQGVERVRIAVADFTATHADPNTRQLLPTFNSALYSDV